MTKKELSQLYYLNKEIQHEIDKLNELRGSKNINISNGWYKDVTSEKAVRIIDLESNLNANIQKYREQANRINNYIQSINDSYIRQILTLRYINHLPWRQIARSIGNNTEDSVRKAHDRFLAKEGIVKEE